MEDTNGTRRKYAAESFDNSGKFDRRHIGEQCEENPTEYGRSYEVDVDHWKRRDLLVSIWRPLACLLKLQVFGEGTFTREP